MANDLEKELETYRRELPKLLAFAGQYVVIHGDKVIGVYRCLHDASLIGCEKLGVETAFLVRKIALEEEVMFSLFDPELFKCTRHPAQ